MSRKTFSRRQIISAAGATLFAGCAAVEPPNPSTNGESLVGETRASDEDRFVALYEAVRDSVLELRVVVPDSPFGEGGGAGFFIDEETVLTNAHVVRDRDIVDVRYADDSWTEGTVLATDIHSDLAVIEVAEGYQAATPLTLAEGFPQVGEEAMAIGSPLGFSASATTGIISGVNRSLPTATNFSIPAAIQTDAGVNPGNSGGPLVDLDGTVLGIIFAGAGRNIGFAISAPMANRVIPDLRAGESFDHSYLGAQLTDVSPRLAGANDLPEARGVYVDATVPDSPAAGILNGSTDQTVVDDQQVPIGGDVILAMDDEPIPHLDALSGYLALETDPGDIIELTIYRDDTEQTVDLELGVRPEAPVES